MLSKWETKLYLINKMRTRKVTQVSLLFLSRLITSLVTLWNWLNRWRTNMNKRQEDSHWTHQLLANHSINQYQHKVYQLINMKQSVHYILLLLCVASTITSAKRKKCGFVADKCVLLANGNVFWPLNWKAECSSAPICPRGYSLHHHMLGELRACCCLLKRMEICPDCDIWKSGKQTYKWIEMHLKRNGPPDGKCLDGKLKTIFFGGPNHLDKCCCEPKWAYWTI